MSEKATLDWKTYESITKYIYEELGRNTGVKVLGYGQTCKVPGKSGVSHQIDILTAQSDGIHTCRTAIECKYWNEKVSKETVAKLAGIIEDAGIEKGVIVSKSGFTADGAEYAKYRNIRLVELREADQEIKQAPLQIATIEIRANITIRRPEIASTEIEYEETGMVKKELFNEYSTTITLSDGSRKPFTDYTKAFRNELHGKDKIGETISMRHEIPGGGILQKRDAPPAKIKAIIFTGVLKQINKNHNHEILLEDKVWLLMQSIFEGKTFTITETGLIVENKK